MDKLLIIINALYKGKCLENVETWKNVQQATIAVTAILGLIPYMFPDFPITENEIGNLAEGIVALGGLVASYLTSATSTKMGLTKHTEENINE